jgi:hypothetical protein
MKELLLEGHPSTEHIASEISRNLQFQLLKIRLQREILKRRLEEKISASGDPMI